MSVRAIDLKENMYAFCLWVQTPNLSIEQAFELLESGIKRRRNDLTDEDFENIIQMQKEMNFCEIAKVFNINYFTLRSYVVRYKESKAGDKNEYVS